MNNLQAVMNHDLCMTHEKLDLSILTTSETLPRIQVILWSEIFEYE